jgi:glutaredoxin
MFKKKTNQVVRTTNPNATKLILLGAIAIMQLMGSRIPGGAAICIGAAAGADSSQKNELKKVRCIALECYAKLSDESSKAEVEFIQAWVKQRQGVALKVYDLDAGDKERSRLKQIESAYKVADLKLPVVYGMNQVIAGAGNEDKWKSELARLLTVQVYTRQGCSKCIEAKAFLEGFVERYPGIEVRYSDAVEDAAAKKSYSEIIRNQRIGGVSFPGFWFCQQLVVGFESASFTGGRLVGILKRWTYDCEIPKITGYRTNQNEDWLYAEAVRITFSPIASLSTVIAVQPPDDSPPLEMGDPSTDLPIPTDGFDASSGQTHPSEPQIPSVDEVDVPWIGRVSASRMGMPVFTLLVGLVDGFNPCAMWVLLFLLSVLVNLRVRWKILAVAGTFVVVSGLAYFAFIAAWLNVLLFVGYLRWVQILLAILAIVVGSIHVKDFFALHRGLTLSIPESAKPGIYARVRSIVMAEHLYGAISGAFVLAVLVNFVELLCTAGLPALYSQVLMLQGYPTWKNYAYLALYIFAYMLDDSIMVAIVIFTLGKRKLQENEGRWLKLASGLVILLLGVLLLLKPDWLT